MVVRSEVEEDIEVREAEMIHEVREELGLYHWFYISLHFIKEDGAGKREERVGVKPDTDEEEIEDVVLDDDRISNQMPKTTHKEPRARRYSP